MAIRGLEQLFFSFEVGEFLQCRAIDQQILQSTSGVGNAHRRQDGSLLLWLRYTWFLGRGLFNFGPARYAISVPLTAKGQTPHHKWQGRCGRRTRGGRGAARHNGFPFVGFLPQTGAFRRHGSEILLPSSVVESCLNLSTRAPFGLVCKQAQEPCLESLPSSAKSHCPPAPHQHAAPASLSPPM